MRRKTFDKLVASAGLLIAGLLVAAGGLLLWGNSFVSDQVNDQLSAQQIYFPEAGSEGLQDPAIKPYLEKYAGEQLTTGAQAKAYADHYIAVHLDKMTGGQTYAELSHKAMANPDDQKLAGQVATVFKGETLRGMLLNAWGWGTIGTVATIAGVALIGIGGVLLAIPLLAAFAARRREPAGAAVRMPEPTAAA
jgi:hypothetical protein